MIGEIFTRYGSDKDTAHSYGPVYADLFAPIRETTRLVLELGIANGASLRAWRDYFPHAEIWGVDVYPGACASVAGEPRIRAVCGDAASPAVVGPAQLGGWQWDIIIDDAGHGIQDQVMSFFWLFPYLKPGGSYVVEDVLEVGHLQHFHCFAGEVQLLDRRALKGRADDMMAIIRKA